MIFKKRTLFLLILTVCYLLKVTPVYADGIESSLETVPNCGVRSVLDMARFIEKNVTRAQAQNMCATYPNEHISMLQVSRAAQSINIQLEGKRISLDELEKQQTPFIAVLPDHFVFVERVFSSWVRLSEAGELILRPRSNFERQYLGKALVPIPQQNIGMIVLDQPIVDLHHLALGISKAEVRVHVKNTGTRAVAIRRVTTSCSCTVLDAAPTNLQPGEKAEMRLSISLPAAGAFSSGVFIYNDGLYPVAILTILGTIENDVRLDPSRFTFGQVVAGTQARRTIEIHDVDHKLPRPIKVSTTAENLTATLTPQGEDVWEIAVTLTASQLGDVDAGLSISGPSKDSRVVRVPIQARIVPMTRARPEQVIFGSVAPKGATRRLQIFRQDRQPFEVTGIESPPYLRTEIEAANTRHSEWTVRVSIDPAKAPAQVSDKIVVKTRHDGKDETIEVAVLALNESNVAPALPTAADAAMLPRAEDDPHIPIGSPLPPFKVGEVAPDFRATDANGNPWHLNALRGQKNVLLTFFPKCFTGGCANHLSSLRDHQKEFDAADTQILAISVDSADGEKGQLAFAKQWGFTFPLIPDTSRQLSKQFGALQNDEELAARMSVLIDNAGVVRWLDTEVAVKTHGADVLGKIRELGLAS